MKKKREPLLITGPIVQSNMGLPKKGVTEIKKLVKEQMYDIVYSVQINPRPGPNSKRNHMFYVEYSKVSGRFYVIHNPPFGNTERFSFPQGGSDMTDLQWAKDVLWKWAREKIEALYPNKV